MSEVLLARHELAPRGTVRAKFRHDSKVSDVAADIKQRKENNMSAVKKEGVHKTGKPITHDPKPGHHSGRPHPPVVDPNKVVKGLSKELKKTDE